MKIIQSFPWSAHFLATPDWYRSVWISPWPCGLVTTLKSESERAMLAWLSSKAGTFSYFTISISSFFIPK